MKQITTVVARQYRLQEWALQIQECKRRSSGMTVKEWCNNNGITLANYYYRLTEVRKACIENLPTELPVPEQSVVSVPNEIMHNENPTISDSTELVLSVNNISIKVTETTSPKLLKMVLEVAADVK